MAPEHVPCGCLRTTCILNRTQASPIRILVNQMWKKISVAAAGTVLGGLILAVIPKTSGLVVKVVLWVWSGLSWIWELLYSSHPVPGGVILVLSLLALFGLAVVVLRSMRLPQPHGEEQAVGPDFRNYTEAYFDGAKWRWSWRSNEIYNLWCFCPVCDAQLVPDGGYTETNFICERCPSDGTFFPPGSRGKVVATMRGGDRHYAVEAAKREILRRIRTGQR